MAEFFTRNIILVYFLYGLSFFSMGFAILLETGRTSELDFAQALRPLAGFGLVHGIHEWLEMFLLIHGHYTQEAMYSWIGLLRISLLATSFLMLVAFGIRLISGTQRPKLRWITLASVIAVWLGGLWWIIASQTGQPDLLVACDVYTRYALAIPGGLLAAYGLIVQRSRFFHSGMQSFGQDVGVAALAFGLYGFIGQLFASSSTVFPSAVFNAASFLNWFGFPIQVFRAIMAGLAAVGIVRSLRAFEAESRQRIENLRQAQIKEQARLEEARAALLHQTVIAQESERQRIARELHDELGQILTALGMGLRGMADMVKTNPERAAQQAAELEKVAGNGMDELQHLVTGLRPPQLDDLGLLAALRWYANEIHDRSGLTIQINSQGSLPVLSEEVRVALYRIAQEAITNTLRHAHTKQASIQLRQINHDVVLRIEDSGAGFDMDATFKEGWERPCWGLLGMVERAELIGGKCLIASSVGRGTLVEVTVALEAGDVP